MQITIENQCILFALRPKYPNNSKSTRSKFDSTKKEKNKRKRKCCRDRRARGENVEYNFVEVGQIENMEDFIDPSTYLPMGFVESYQIKNF